MASQRCTVANASGTASAPSTTRRAGSASRSLGEVRQPEGDGCDPGDRAEKPWTHGRRDVERHGITTGGVLTGAAEL
jgi:hypothetical protein